MISSGGPYNTKRIFVWNCLRNTSCPHDYSVTQSVSHPPNSYVFATRDFTSSPLLQSGPVSVGDVGFISDDRFVRLSNIHLRSDHPSHGKCLFDKRQLHFIRIHNVMIKISNNPACPPLSALIHSYCIVPHFAALLMRQQMSHQYTPTT
jgi:hypothetical protein